MTSDAEEIENDSVHRQESLRVGGGFEPSHLSLALSRGLVSEFRPVIFVLLGAVNRRRQDRAVGGRVAAKLIGDQSSWLTALTFQQLTKKALGGMSITLGLDEDVDHIAVLVDSPPEILLPTLDIHEQLDGLY